MVQLLVELPSVGEHPVDEWLLRRIALAHEVLDPIVVQRLDRDPSSHRMIPTVAGTLPQPLLRRLEEVVVDADVLGVEVVGEARIGVKAGRVVAIGVEVAGGEAIDIGAPFVRDRRMRARTQHQAWPEDRLDQPVTVADQREVDQPGITPGHELVEAADLIVGTDELPVHRDGVDLAFGVPVEELGDRGEPIRVGYEKLVRVQYERPLEIEDVRQHAEGVAIGLVLRRHPRADLAVDPGDDPRTCQRCKQLVRTVVVVVAVDIEPLEADRPVVGDPLEKVDALVARRHDHAGTAARPNRTTREGVAGVRQRDELSVSTLRRQTVELWADGVAACRCCSGGGTPLDEGGAGFQPSHECGEALSCPEVRRVVLDQTR